MYSTLCMTHAVEHIKRVNYQIHSQRVGKPALFSCPEGGDHLYPVSNAFLNAVKENARKYYWTGRITTKSGTVYDFDQDDMVKGSGYITSRC